MAEVEPEKSEVGGGGTLASYTDTQLIFYTENLFRPKHRETGGRGPTGPPLG